MKICDLTQSYAATGGGVRTYIHARIDYMREHAPRDEHLLVVPGAEDAVRREGRFTVRTVASPYVPGSRVYRLLLRSGEVSRILREERPDVVESHCQYNLPWTALHYRDRHSGTRVVATCMTDVARAYVGPVASRILGRALGARAARLADRYARALYRRVDATVAISPALAGRVRGLGAENVHYVPLGVDLETFHPSRRDPALRRRLGVPDDALLLVYAGRMDAEKRPALVAEAFRRLPPSFRGALALAGDGPQREALAAVAAWDPRIHVLPFVSDRAELATLLASADVYVSAMPYETFGLSVLEAQACGLPVVGVAGGAMPERVPPGRGVGRLGPVDSVEGLAANILALAAEGPRAAGLRARQMVEAEYSWRRTFERVFGLYRELLPAAP